MVMVMLVNELLIFWNKACKFVLSKLYFLIKMLFAVVVGKIKVLNFPNM